MSNPELVLALQRRTEFILNIFSSHQAAAQPSDAGQNRTQSKPAVEKWNLNGPRAFP